VWLVGICLVCGGCQDVDWDREWQWWNPSSRRVRPTRTAYRPAPEQREKTPQAREAQPQPAGRVAPQQPPAPPEVVEGGLFRLELLSAPGELRRESNVSRLKLARTRAVDVAAVIEMLLPGMGRGGSDDRHYLLYQSETVWRLASHFAGLADVEPVEGLPGETPTSAPEAFGKGVGMVYAMLRPGRREAQRVLRAESLLNAAVQAETAERSVRWAAAMLAGKLLSAARFDQFDFEGARKHYLVAQTHSEPTSFPHMVALFARAKTYEQAGQPDEARKLHQRIAAEFVQLAGSSLYQQVRRGLEQQK